MAANKTQPNLTSVTEFVNAIENKTRRQDALTLMQMMQEATNTQPTMWGPSIIGYGQVHYRYESGREGDILRMGFSPRKANLALYVKHDKRLLEKLGKHKLSVACLYINKLADVDLDILMSLLKLSWKNSLEKTPCQ